MKIKDLKFEDRDNWLKITDLETTFNVFLDSKDNYHYNLNQTLYFNIPEYYFQEFICTHDMHWPLISYKIYGTTRLAWILMKFNNVQTKDVFKKKLSGDKIKYISQEKMQDIISTLND